MDFLSGRELGSAPTRDRERMVERHGVGPQGLLLGDPRTGAQPWDGTSGPGELFGQAAQCRAVAGLLLVDLLVRRESPPGPPGAQCPLRPSAVARAVGVAHRLDHGYCHARARRIMVGWTRPEANNGVVYRCTHHVAKVCRSIAARSSKKPSTNVSPRSPARSVPRGTRPSSSSWRCPNAYPYGRSATGSTASTPLVNTNEGRSSRLLRGESCLSTVLASGAVDQLVLRRRCRRPNIGGRQTPCREPAQHRGHAPYLPVAEARGLSGAHR
jgi:hypothetical protein